MENFDFVTYEQAKALKELGFNKRCLAYYDTMNQEFNASNINDDYLGDIRDYFFDYNSPYSCLTWRISAPTLAQAQKWLRKEKNLYIYSVPVPIDSVDSYSCTVYNVQTKEELYVLDYFNSPEEAISAGISAAIEFLTK